MYQITKNERTIISFVIFLFGIVYDACPQITFTSHTISTNADGACSVYAIDLDGDNDLDVLSASVSDHKIAWYENLDGKGKFGPQIVISSTTFQAWDVFAVDLDGDGDVDVLSASSYYNMIAWYENIDGKGNFGSMKVITHSAKKAVSVHAADIDNDGDADVLSASHEDNKIAWYENTDGKGIFGEQNIITESAEYAKSVYAADLDGDNDMDVLSASVQDYKIAWYENIDGKGTFGEQQIITGALMHAECVFAADIDGDADMDVLGASSSQHMIVWFENIDGRGTFRARGTVSWQTYNAESVFAADMDGDEDMDVLSASGLDNKIAWYENIDGKGTFGEQQIITLNAAWATCVFSADLDSDGDMDVLSASLQDDKIAWYEQIQELKLVSPNGGNLLEGGAEHEINWSSSDLSIDHITLAYSTDGGDTYSHDIGTNVPNDGSFLWYPPNTLITNCKIKIQAFDAYSELLAEDESDDIFIIGYTTKTNFEFKKHNYSFSNLVFTNSVFNPIYNVINDPESRWRFPEFKAIILYYSHYFSWGGNCAGMSKSSIDFLLDESKIPVKGKTTYDLSVEEAHDNIISGQRSINFNLLNSSLNSLLDLLMDDNMFLAELETRIARYEPAIITLRGRKYEKRIGHAIVAYKIIDFGIAKRVYVYEVNRPLENNRYLDFILQNGSYKFAGYKLGSFVFTSIDIVDHEGSSILVQQFWNKFWLWLNEVIHNLFVRDNTIFTLNCPADALIVDEYGRKTGFENDLLLNDIPGAEIISSDSLEVYELPTTGNYTITISGTDTGEAEVNFLIPVTEKEIIKSIKFSKIPLQLNSHAQIQLAQSNIDTSFLLDLENDGVYEKTIPAETDTSIEISKPDAPSELIALNKGNDILLEWVDNSNNEVAFFIDYREDVETEFQFLASTKENITTFLDTEIKYSPIIHYRVKAIAAGGESKYSNEAVINISTQARHASINSPKIFALYNCYPNPFNSNTTIQYQVPIGCHVTIQIYNSMGQVVCTLVDGYKFPGKYLIDWNGRDWKNLEVSSGLYFLKMVTTEDNVISLAKSTKMLYIK